MQKISTLILSFLLCFIAATAEDVVVYVVDWDYEDISDPIDGKLTLNEDGSLTLSNFLNSGSSLVFNFDRNVEVDEYTGVEFSGNILKYEYDGDFYYYPKTEAGKYIVGKLYEKDDLLIEIHQPYIYGSDKYTWIQRIDPEENYGYNYLASFLLCGDDADGEELDDWIRVYFYLNIPSEAGVTAVTADSNASVEYFNLQGIKVAKPENGLFIRRQGTDTRKVIIK